MSDNNAAQRSPASNAVWNAVSTLWGIGISFLLAPVLIHTLGADAYGLLLLVWSVTGLLAMSNLGVGEATLRYVAHYLADNDLEGVRRVFGSTLFFYVVISVGISLLLASGTDAVVGFISLPPGAESEARWLVRFSAVLYSLTMITNAFRSIPMALHRYDVNSKVGFAQGIVRNLGFIVLALLGFGVVDIVIWELGVALVSLMGYVYIAKRFIPSLPWLPRPSASGLREIFGYGFYSFLTQIFLSAYRESGKLIIGKYVGPAGVAYLGTPDNVAYRLYMVVVSGVETLMPRFSASRDSAAAKALLINATQTAIAIGVIFFIPLAVLMPDLLRLWINREFAEQSALVGELLALSFLAPAAFAPVATFYRGVGKPGFVTIVMAAVAVTVVAVSLILVPSLGAAGVGYGYLLGGVSWWAGLYVGWFRLFGVHASLQLLRATVPPLAVGALAYFAQTLVRSALAPLGWIELVIWGGLFAAVTAVSLFLLEKWTGAPSVVGEFAETGWRRLRRPVRTTESTNAAPIVSPARPGEASGLRSKSQ